MDKTRALKYLFRIISVRDYLEAQLIKKLISKEVSLEDIDELILKLKNYGYVDDEKYVESFIYFSIKKLDGPYKIKNKLLFKGANLELVELSLDEQYSLEKKRENLQKLFKKNKRERDKFIAFCARKGYPMDLILEVVNQ